MAVEHFQLEENLIKSSDQKAWIRAIKANDVTLVIEILENSDDKTQSKLLNGEFHTDRHGGKEYEHIRFRHSVAMAAGCNARDVIEIMLSYGADVTVRERHGNNILHVLTLLCGARCELEPDIVELYRWLTGKLDVDITRELLHSENDEGMRPLELAAQKGFFQLVVAIYQTKDVYLVEEEDEGILTYQHFDITEYEGPTADRHDKSPMAFITYMRSECLCHDGVRTLSGWAPFEQWYQLKARANYPLAFIWILFRLVMVSSYYVIMLSFGDRIRTTPDSLCDEVSKMFVSEQMVSRVFVFTAITSISIILFDVVEFTLRRCLHRPFAVYKNAYNLHTVVSVLFYRVIQLALSWLFVVASTLYLSIGPPGPSKSTLVEVMNIGVVAGTSACILYFVQLVPALGHYVVIINRMLTDLVFFMILYLICLLPFAFYFMVFFSNHSNAGCVTEFSSYWQSMYSSFMLMLNMINFRDHDLRNFELIQIMHFCFVFIIALLLVNFLIAVMSKSTSEISDHKYLVQRLERMQIFITIEFRTYWLLKRYYGYIARRLGMVKDGRVLLTKVTWNPHFEADTESNRL